MDKTQNNWGQFRQDQQQIEQYKTVVDNRVGKRDYEETAIKVFEHFLGYIRNK